MSWVSGLLIRPLKLLQNIITERNFEITILKKMTHSISCESGEEAYDKRPPE